MGIARVGRSKRRGTWTTVLLVLGIVFGLISLGTIGAAWALSTHYNKNINRADLLGTVPSTSRSAASDSDGEGDGSDSSDIVGPLNFLVLGSDSRLADPSVDADTVGQRSDTIILVHVTADLRHAYVVSIPRDSYVDIPADGDWQGGKNKINAAFAYGGAPLAARTIYNLTDSPLDGAVVVDFNGVRKMVNAVGGVRVCTTYTVRSIHTDRVWPAGCNHLTGDAAQDFMRQRYSVPGSDFGRIHDQQLVLQALLSKAASGGTLTNPLRFTKFLEAATSAITVDQSMDVVSLAKALRHLRSSDITFATVPHTSATLETPYGLAVKLDEAGTKAMFEAVNNDQLEEYLAAQPAATSLLKGGTAGPSPSDLAPTN